VVPPMFERNTAGRALLMWPVTGPTGTSYYPKGSRSGSQGVFVAVCAGGLAAGGPSVSGAVPRLLVLIVACVYVRVGDTGFEPVTFPASRDALTTCRQKPLDTPAALPGLDLSFAPSRPRQIFVVLSVHHPPRATTPRRRRVARVVIGQPTLNIGRRTDIEPAVRLTLQDVRRAHQIWWAILDSNQ
jgi:hypothetical protein